jgi:hypothetical protein
MQSARRKLPAFSAALCAAVAALCLLAVSAQAATYPPGGGAFNGGLEGWTTPVKPACNIPLMGLCTTTAGYDGENGNPAGSLAANTTILLNLGGVFKSTAVFQSPNFTASEGGAATLHVDRELASGNLLDLAPKADYVVTLIDRSTGIGSEAITDSVAGVNAAFTGKDGAATLVAGHSYAISIDAETSSSVANVGLLGSTSLRFDNVSLTVGTSGGGGGGGGNNGGNGGNGNGGGGGGAGNGANGLSDSRLLSLLQSSSGGTAVLKGNRLFVKRPCPAKIGRSCHLSIQGLLKKNKPATTKRTSKVAKGKTKQLVLKVKPKAKAKLATSKRLLFKETVKAGQAKATVYKRLKLIRRR